MKKGNILKINFSVTLIYIELKKYKSPDKNIKEFVGKYVLIDTCRYSVYTVCPNKHGN